jgi:hypothetical protein
MAATDSSTGGWHMRPIRVIVTALLTTGLLICVSSMVFTRQAIPRAGSYRAAVIAVLNTAQIDAQHVEVMDGCAPTMQFCRTYAGIVHVQSSHTMTGQIACLERWTTCTFTLHEAGIIAAPLPDVLDPLIWRWEQLQAQILQAVREMGR